MAAAVALCFRNRALLTVPDFRKSPLVEYPKNVDLPASAVFVPMFAQREVLGVVAVQFRVRLKTNRNQQAALQHVANQIAASLTPSGAAVDSRAIASNGKDGCRRDS